MPGLLGAVARTAVISGTATAVSGRVQRRQAERFADRDAGIYAQRQAAYAQQTTQPQYAVPPVAGTVAVGAPAPPPTPPRDPMVAQIEQLAALRDQGILTDEEFTAKKAQVLGI
jgi:hypothetical protein